MRLTKITSLTNDRIKHVVKIRERKLKSERNLTIVDGFREFKMASSGKIRCEEVFICREYLSKEELLELSQNDSKLAQYILANRAVGYEVTKDVFAKIAFGGRDSGVLALIEPKERSLDQLQFKDKALIVVVESVEKPGNLGAILRSCDGVGVDAVLVCDQQTDIYNPNVIRSSLGTIFTLPVVKATNEDAFLFLRKNKIKICATLPEARTVYSKIDFNQAMALIVGSEDKGLSPFWESKSDFQVKIPMKGKADSLNVSVSTAVLLYEALRQRG